MMPNNSSQIEAKPWGFWFTIITTIIIIILTYIIEIGAFSLIYHFEKGHNPQLDIYDYLSDICSKNYFIRINTLLISDLIYFPLVIIILLLLVKIKNSKSIIDYFALRKISLKTLSKWTFIMILYFMIFYILRIIFDVPQKFDESSIRFYKWTSFKPAFYFVFIILGPICEEIFFRGYMYKGIEKTFLKSWGAVIITTVFFTSIHWFNLFRIFIIGFLFGLARKKTGSIYVPIAMHIVNNLIAMIIVILHVHGYI